MEPKNLGPTDIWGSSSGRKTEVVRQVSHPHDRIATDLDQNLQLVDRGFDLAGDDHDLMMGSVEPSHPIFYDRQNRQLFKGAPGQYHHEAIEQNPDLSARFHKWDIFNPPPHMYMGRMFNKDTGKEMHWYKHPMPTEKNDVHGLLQATEHGQYDYDDDDMWSDEPPPQTPRSPVELGSQLPSSMRNFLTGAAPLKAELHPGDGFVMGNYDWRVPFSYSRGDQTLHVGQPATIHGSLPRGGYPRWDGMIALQSHQPKHGYTPGMTWLDTHAYDAPSAEEHQQVQQALAQHYPEAAQDFQPAERPHDDFYDEDDLWGDEEESDVPIQPRFQGDGLRLGWVDEVENHETAFSRIWNNR